MCHDIPLGPVTDHPRIRGEHLQDNMPPSQTTGSSPHTRGARSPACASAPRVWIIPAYAGSTPGEPKASTVNVDHPRIRGEHISSFLGGVVAGGSSPHTRGAPFQFSFLSLGGWIIPAYAGSTRMLGNDTPLPGDHPRIRGEHIQTFKGV